MVLFPVMGKIHNMRALSFCGLLYIPLIFVHPRIESFEAATQIKFWVSNPDVLQMFVTPVLNLNALNTVGMLMLAT